MTRTSHAPSPENTEIEDAEPRVETRRRFIERLKRAGAVAVPLAVVASLDVPEAHGGY